MWNVNRNERTLLGAVALLLFVFLGASIFIEMRIQKREYAQMAEDISVQLACLLQDEINEGGALLSVLQGLEDPRMKSYLDEKVRLHLREFNMKKVKIFDADRILIYADSPELEGKSHRGKALLEQAFAGVIGSKVIDPKEYLDAYGERLFTSLIETYLPICDHDGEVLFVMEVYQDFDPMAARIREGIQRTATILGVLALLTLGVAYRLIRSVSDAHNKIKTMAVTDELTGLTNRRHFFERLRVELARFRRHGTPLGCMMIDLDHFKAVNDTYGHPAGDLLLKEIAKLMRELHRAADIPARYGGEEFICLLPQTDRAGCETTAERLRARIEALQCTLENGTILKVTASIGVSLLTKGMEAEEYSEQWLVKSADEALYLAKESGRNRVEFHS